MYEITDWTIQRQLCYKHTKKLYMARWEQLAFCLMLYQCVNFIISPRGKGKQAYAKLKGYQYKEVKIDD